jgi:hypothetical protein
MKACSEREFEMEQERIEQLLNEIAQRTAEPVRPGLADEIKARIPDKPARHKSGLDTIRIIIDLRVTKLAAAAAIIITLLLCVTLLGGKDPAGSSFLQNTKDLVRYFLMNDTGSQLASFAKAAKNDELDREVVYYGETAGSSNPDALLMHWKLEDNKYRVVFCNFRTEVVTASDLIKLQAQMLKKMTNK